MSMMNAYAVDEITIIQWNGNDSWGEPESATSVTVHGYVDWKTRLVRDQRGEEARSSVMVYLPKRRTDDALGRALLHEDRLIVGDVPMNRAIIEIRQPKDFSRPHYEVYLA